MKSGLFKTDAGWFWYGMSVFSATIGVFVILA
jgi:hypothetical protein